MLQGKAFMLYSIKRSMSLLILLFISVGLVSCETTNQSMPPEESTPPEESSPPEESTPASTPETPKAEPKLPPMPMKNVEGKGYLVEMGRSWSYMASLSAGQENTFAVDQYPGLKTTFNGSKVLITAFINRISSTADSYLNDFSRTFNEFNLLESIPQEDGYLLVMNRKSDRNSLRYVRLFYHAELKQALAYNLTFRVIGDEQLYRTSYTTDTVAQEILEFFHLT
ncbi:hypothetical protein [Entomospira culicis]|uniref:Uncharacterized protein n=1 Tax=Entomospira culicis TaxID=2719989 RepID=A0A968GFS1_9SPIO|nr:hypothetical protein [Entomospira culicis]NIZ19319.1 hypothetical protein [Entomospira culicis]NIZ69776.1 hypothetical protein [Entomospira culicis]WDI36887.1 hypothetical protein PVA46_06055 [Entomospira culicis]WDI38516.1 hypothetical protein PVA47_06065 [Entomospira culicis]